MYMKFEFKKVTGNNSEEFKKIYNQVHLYNLIIRQTLQRLLEQKTWNDQNSLSLIFMLKITNRFLALLHQLAVCHLILSDEELVPLLKVLFKADWKPSPEAFIALGKQLTSASLPGADNLVKTAWSNLQKKRSDMEFSLLAGAIGFMLILIMAIGVTLAGGAPTMLPVVLFALFLVTAVFIGKIVHDKNQNHKGLEKLKNCEARFCNLVDRDLASPIRIENRAGYVETTSKQCLDRYQGLGFFAAEGVEPGQEQGGGMCREVEQQYNRTIQIAEPSNRPFFPREQQFDVTITDREQPRSYIPR